MEILIPHRTSTCPVHTGGQDLPAETWLEWMPVFLRHLVSMICIVMCIGFPIPSQVIAQGRGGEYALKAALLYNFVKFAEWPAAAFHSDRAPFVVCTVGHTSLDSELDQLSGKVVRDRPLVTKHIPSHALPNDCHLLYIGPNESKHAPEILRTLQMAPVLTACDSEGCAEAGFMINMRMVENKVTLDLNLDAVQQTPLKLSSQLIKLTHIVKGHP